MAAPDKRLRKDWTIQKTLETLQMMPQELSSQIASLRTAYWGGLGAPGQVPPNAPPYIGALICFLALIGFFILDHKHKWWVLGASALAFMMSWGEYFEGFKILRTSGHLIRIR